MANKTVSQARDIEAENQLCDCTMYAERILALLGMLRTYTDKTKGPAKAKVRALLTTVAADIRLAFKTATPGAFMDAATQAVPMLDTALGEWATDNGSDEEAAACAFGLYDGILAALAKIQDAALPLEATSARRAADDLARGLIGGGAPITPALDQHPEICTLPGELGARGNLALEAGCEIQEAAKALLMLSGFEVQLSPGATLGKQWSVTPTPTASRIGKTLLKRIAALGGTVISCMSDDDTLDGLRKRVGVA